MLSSRQIAFVQDSRGLFFFFGRRPTLVCRAGIPNPTLTVRPLPCARYRHRCFVHVRAWPPSPTAAASIGSSRTKRCKGNARFVPVVGTTQPCVGGWVRAKSARERPIASPCKAYAGVRAPRSPRGMANDRRVRAATPALAWAWGLNLFSAVCLPPCTHTHPHPHPPRPPSTPTRPLSTGGEPFLLQRAQDPDGCHGQRRRPPR